MSSSLVLCHRTAETLKSSGYKTMKVAADQNVFASTLLTATVLSNSRLKDTVPWLRRDVLAAETPLDFDCQYRNQV